MRVCVIGASGRLGSYMVRHCLDRGWEVVGVCRAESVSKLGELARRIEIVPGRTNDAEVVARAVRGCAGVLTVLVPWGVDDYASGTAQAVLDHAEPDARLVMDLDDQVEACRRIFASDRLWTVVRGSDLEEGPGQGLPVWSRHVGDPVLESNLTRRVDFALFMVEALTDDRLIHEAPAIVGRDTPSARAHAPDQGS